MSLSLADCLGRAVARLPAPLVSDRAREPLLALPARACPNVDLCYLEFRVTSDEADQVDVSVCAASYRARSALVRQVQQLAEAAPATWARASRSLGRWCTRGTEEAAAVPAACLEYDLDPGLSSAREPCLFLNVQDLSFSWDLARTRRGLCGALEWVAGQERAQEYSQYLDRLLAALPANFHLAHLGFMFPRADEALRFCLGIPGPELTRCLGRLGWRGSLDSAAEFLASAERAGWVSLSFSLNRSGMHARLGIEAPTLGHRATGSALVAALVRRQLCTPAKAHALTAFLQSPDDGYRAELSHAKLVVDSAGVAETKLYLTVAPSGPRMGQLAGLRRGPAGARDVVERRSIETPRESLPNPAPKMCATLLR